LVYYTGFSFMIMEGRGGGQGNAVVRRRYSFT